MPWVCFAVVGLGLAMRTDPSCPSSYSHRFCLAWPWRGPAEFGFLRAWEIRQKIRSLGKLSVAYIWGKLLMNVESRHARGNQMKGSIPERFDLLRLETINQLG